MSELRETTFDPYVGLADDGTSGVVEWTPVTDTEETALERMRDCLEMFNDMDSNGTIVSDGRIWIELDPGGDIGGYVEADEGVRAWRFDTSGCLP